jgi:endonuclease/exonuclease/phosphatase family metal-dependent hydrolase
VLQLNGDLNYRISLRREQVITALNTNDFKYLFAQDQLAYQIQFNRGFRLRMFNEQPITFAPTYKYDRNTDDYDSSEKRRVPAWCDRVLWRARVEDRVRGVWYRRHEIRVSDHRPVSAAFDVGVKRVQEERRAEVRKEVESLWMKEETKMIEGKKGWLVEMGLVGR